MAQPAVKLHGLKQLHRALKQYGSDLARELDRELREAGDIVAVEAQQRMSVIDVRSAAGIKARTRGFGRVVVEQTRRKTTGQRPDFGSLQMRRALVPARSEKEPMVLQHVEGMLDRLGRDFDRGR